MQGKIIDIATYEDEFHNEEYRITVLFDKKPDLKLGKVEIQQK